MTGGALSKGVRLKHGLTQQEFANLLGIHVMTVSRWERGEIEPPSQTHLLLFVLHNASRETVDQIRDFSPRKRKP